MKQFQIEGYQVSFDAHNHQYYVDGHPVYSISQIARFFYPIPYKNVDPVILKKASEKGILLKDMIEAYERIDKKTFHEEMQGYIQLKRAHQFKVKSLDTVVLIKHHDVIIAAGSFDMLIESPYIKGIGIADIKRMAFIQDAYLRLQLNLYKLGYEQTYRTKIHYLKCIHIRYRHSDYIDIPIDIDLVKHKLDVFIEKHPIDYTLY